MRKYSSFLIAAAVVAGCQSDSPTTVDFKHAAAAPAFDASPALASDAQSAIDDAVDRIAPALSDAPSSARLVAQLRGVQQALGAADAGSRSALVRVADAELNRYAALHPQDSAELDAVRLALGLIGESN